jgi:hypothetical protein
VKLKFRNSKWSKCYRKELKKEQKQDDLYKGKLRRNTFNVHKTKTCYKTANKSLVPKYPKD